MDKCLLCGQKALVTRQDNSSRTIYNCGGCGVFVVSDLAVDAINAHKSEVLSFIIHRRLSGASDTVLISFEKAKLDKAYLQMTVEQIVSLFPKSFSEQMEMALLNLILLSPYPGFEFRAEMFSSGPIFYMKHDNPEALAFIIRSMARRQLVEIKSYGASFFPCGVIVTPEGWDSDFGAKASDNHSDRPKLFLVYCASSSNSKESDTAPAIESAAQKAAKDCKLQFYSNSQIAPDSSIVGNELAGRIRAADIITVDLTNNQPECYFALGFAQALNKRLMITCHEKDRKKLRLDPSRYTVTFWSDEKQLALEMTNYINALAPS